MAESGRTALGITLPPKLIGTLDRLRARGGKDPELRGRDRSNLIEILILKGLEAHRNGDN